MKTSRSNPKRVLAIDPTSRGFGYVVLESPTTPVDWGGKAIRPKEEAKALVKVSDLIRHYRPEILVVEDCLGSRRCARVQGLIDRICRLVETEGVKCRHLPISRVREVFRTFRANNKHEIAHAVAQQLPELASWLPPRRKPWMSEDYRMAIFDAAALALTYFHSRPVGRRSVPRESPAPPESSLAGNFV
jgi:hypothetical protein